MEFLDFHPPGPRGDVLPRSADHVAVGNETPGQKAGVAKVDAVQGPKPVVLAAVLDLKAHITRHVDGLDGGEVDAGDFSVWKDIGVGEFDGPLSCARTQVEDVANMAGMERGEKKSLVETVEDFVLVVETSRFVLVVGEEIAPFFVSVVTASPEHGVV